MLKKEDVLIEDSRSNLRGNKFTGLAKLTDSAKWRSRGAAIAATSSAKPLDLAFYLFFY